MLRGVVLLSILSLLLGGIWLRTQVEIAGPWPPHLLLVTTHPHEAYLPALGLEPVAAYQDHDAFSPDPRQGVQGVAAELARRLNGVGIGSLRLRGDRWGSYAELRPVLRVLRLVVPGLCQLIDVHRDAPRLNTTLAPGPPAAARLLFVVGMGTRGGLPGFYANERLAQRVSLELERAHPGLSRGLYYKAYHYNQDLGLRALLVEFGGVDNSLEQVGRSVFWFSEAYAAVTGGACTGTVEGGNPQARYVLLQNEPGAQHDQERGPKPSAHGLAEPEAA